MVMARAYPVTVQGSRYRGYQEHRTLTFGTERSATHIEIVCDNGVVVTVYPDGTVGRKDWTAENPPRLGGRP